VFEQERLRTLVVGDKIDVTEMGDTSFNEADVAISSIDYDDCRVTLLDPAAGADVAEFRATAGKVQADSGTSMKRWAPFWMSTRVRGGTSSSVTVQVKRWRPEDPEPDWGSYGGAVARTARPAVIPNANIATMPTEPGHCALWTAHLLDSSSVSWGGARFRELEPAR
jgi:hypothetical protein